MGNGISNGSSPSTPVTAAKLIRFDGELQEFYSPVKISNLLTKMSDYFICNSDKMEFDGILSAMEDEEELRQGQLYFELPLTQLTRRLQAEDMSSLALKANAAFALKDDVRSGCYHKWRKRINPLFFSNDDYIRLNESQDLVLDGPACDIQFLFKNKTAKLGVILEE